MDPQIFPNGETRTSRRDPSYDGITGPGCETRDEKLITSKLTRGIKRQIGPMYFAKEWQSEN